MSKQEQHAGHNGREETKVILQPLSPAACCLLQPSFLRIDCLSVSSESTNSWKWYRPNVQGGRDDYVSLAKNLQKQIQQQPDCFCACWCDTRHTHTV